MVKLVDRDSLGEALHVALRKGCDSAATSAAWNCINMMPNSIWGEYVDYIAVHLKKAKGVNESNAAGMLKLFSLKYDPYVIEDQNDASTTKKIRTLPEKETQGRSINEILSERRQWRTLLHCILRTFTDSDWEGFSCYLFY